MEVQLSEENAKLYGKLFVSGRDIAFAKYCAGVLRKKGWHVQPWERRETIYLQQAAFMSALIIAYGRPFTRSKGWPEFPADLIVYSDREAALHERLMTLRHTVHAHSDSANYSIRPWRSGMFSTDLEGVPALRITLQEATIFQAMTSRLQTSIARLKMLLATVPEDCRT